MDYEYAYEYTLDMLTRHCHSGNCCGFYNNGTCPLHHISVCSDATGKDWDNYFKQVQNKEGK